MAKLGKIVEQLQAIIGGEKKTEKGEGMTEEDVKKMIEEKLKNTKEEKDTEDEIVFKNKEEFEEVLQETVKAALGVN